MTLVVAKDRAEARRLQRRAEQGQLRRVYARIYTDDLATPLETLSRHELYALCALVTPGSIISDRSALEGRPTSRGDFFLTGPYRRDIQLPGIRLRIAKGPGPLPTDIRIPTLVGDTFCSSQPRALLENLARSRGPDPDERRTIGPAGVETWLDRFLSRESDEAINALRDTASQIAQPLRYQTEFERLDRIIGALLGTRAARLRSLPAIARAAGKPYEGSRIALFDALVEHLKHEPLVLPEADKKADDALQAFVESYFSNYIEGTEFELEQAHEIVVRGRPLDYREDDSHDILGTCRAILESKADASFPETLEDFIGRLRRWNRQVIESRLAQHPGELKTVANRAGNTVFVLPDLVTGTLEKGYERIMAAATPANRAAVAMFVVTEVHPFADGNGRTARLAMNQFLTAAGLARVIIPTVYRDDYISALKAMSSGHAVPLARMLKRAGEFSRWIDFRSKAACFKALRDSRALERPEDARLRFAR